MGQATQAILLSIKVRLEPSENRANRSVRNFFSGSNVQLGPILPLISYRK